MMNNKVFMDLDVYITPDIDSQEKFEYNSNELDFTILEFWKWCLSDLVENRNRGILAEFIIKKALQIKSTTRLEWDNYDLITEEGIKIEVKSSAYIQSWKQSKYSNIVFNIKKSKKIFEDSSLSKDSYRQADIYIFCLLNHKDQTTINPMKLDQWVFYILKTETLNKQLNNQKKIGLNSLKKLEHIECSFNELKIEFDKIKNTVYNKA